VVTNAVIKAKKIIRRLNPTAMVIVRVPPAVMIPNKIHPLRVQRPFVKTQL